MREEPLQDFVLMKKRSLVSLPACVVSHGVTFDGCWGKWLMEHKVEAERVACAMHDFVVYAVEMGATHDQLDLAGWARSSCSTKSRRGVALSLVLASDAIADQARQMELMGGWREDKQ